jgi:hypothetical protein
MNHPGRVHGCTGMTLVSGPIAGIGTVEALKISRPRRLYLASVMLVMLRRHPLTYTLRNS